MDCVICGSKTEVLEDVKFGNTYHCCVHCEFIGIDMNNYITIEEEKKEYDRHENSISNEGYVNFFKRFLVAAVFPFIETGKGLDFGSGPEPVLTEVMLRDYHYNMDHYDLHYQPEKVYEGKHYDYIISTEVAEHLKNPMRVFRLLHKHLKEGGILAVMTLFHERDDEKFLQWWYRRDVTHISFFTPQTFRVIAEIIGFEVIYTDNKRYITLRKTS